jgi:opacity protein-like surface antigen
MKSLILLAILILPGSFTAQAQDTPKAELFGGYAYAGSGSNGFAASIVGNVNDWLGLGAEISGQYTRLNEAGITEQINSSSFLFGPQFSIRKNKAVTPFVHAKFGVSRIRTETNEFGPPVSFSDKSFGMALGGGLDIRLNDMVAIRAVQIDYLRTHFFNQTQNKGRIAVGLVLRFGKK